MDFKAWVVFNEAKVETVHTEFRSVRVWIDPVPSEVRAIYQNVGELRGIYSNRQFFFWESDACTHSFMVDALEKSGHPVSRKAGFVGFYFRDGRIVGTYQSLGQRWPKADNDAMLRAFDEPELRQAI